MRHLMAVGGLIVVCIVAGLGFMARKSTAALYPGVLTEQVNALVTGWSAQNTPPEDRVMDLIISDAEEEAEQKQPEEKSLAYASEDMQVLSSADEPSAVGRLGTWFHRTFFRRTMKAPENTAFVKTLANKPGAVVWTHKGFEDISEDEMTREFMRAILKADEAGAVVNIVTQGRAAASAIRAVKLLQKAKLPNGHMPAVAKIIAVNMNRATLQRINSGFFNNFSKPENLRELAFAWSPPADPKRVILELFTPGYNKVRFEGGELFAKMGGNGGPQDIYRLIEAMQKKIYTLEAVIGHLAGKVEAEKEVVRAAARAEAKAKIAATAEEEEERAAAQAEAEAKAKAEAEAKAKAEAKKTWTAEGVTLNLKKQVVTRPKQPETRQTDNKRGNAANCKGNPPSCNWWDARAYCGGSLPSVARLQADYRSECTGGRQGNTCNYYYWSGEETSAEYARYVRFGNGDVGYYSKGHNYYVRCR